MNTKVELTKEWCKAHRFPIKETTNFLYWQTNAATARLNKTTGELKWTRHDTFTVIPEKYTATFENERV